MKLITITLLFALLTAGSLNAQSYFGKQSNNDPNKGNGTDNKNVTYNKVHHNTGNHDDGRRRHQGSEKPNCHHDKKTLDAPIDNKLYLGLLFGLGLAYVGFRRLKKA